MAIAKTQKASILKKFKKSEMDTGSSEVQVALLTATINEMTKHFALHKKDHSSKRGLVKAVNQRRKLLDYLKRTEITRYNQIVKELDLRK